MSFLNENEIDSQSDDSEDEEYKPGGQSDAYSHSEEESNCSDEEDEEVENKKIKKSAKKERNRKGRKKNGDTEVENCRDDGPPEVGLTEEDEKKRSDALWADFLSDTNVERKEHSKASSTVSQSNDSRSSESSDTDKSKSLKETHSPEEPPKQIVQLLEKETPKPDPTKPSVSKPAAKPSGIPVKRPAGGIHSILGQLNKKNKVTVLERSKQDWDSFKSSQGLNEELRSFNRGKEGYLEKQDFLERTDLRQFEIEKGMRQGKRNK